MPNRAAEVRRCLERMQHHLDVTYSLFQVKLLWLHRIEHEDNNYTIDIVDPIVPSRHVLTIVATGQQLKAHQEPYLTEIRRAFINDLFLTIARDAVLARNFLNGKDPPEPEFHTEQHEEEVAALNPFLTKVDKRFLVFFRRIRNSTVHYDGNHNVRNRLNFEFNGIRFLTTDESLGTQIKYSLSDLVAIYQRLKSAFDVERIIENPYLQNIAARQLGSDSCFCVDPS